MDVAPVPGLEEAVVIVHRQDAELLMSKMDFFPLGRMFGLQVDVSVARRTDSWPVVARLGFNTLRNVGFRLEQEVEARADEWIRGKGTPDLAAPAKLAEDIFNVVPREATKKPRRL